MELIREFKHLGRHDAPLAGGKGASLGEMTQAGIPIPPGFVVLAHTFDRFLAETDLTQEIEAILATVRHDEMHTVERASEKIQGLILAATMPADIASAIMAEYEKLGAEFVAVRSSATAEDGAEHAWAGQLDTHLNTPKEEVLRNVQRCWASLFTPRAIFYRFEKGLHGTTISVAVVIQKMVQSEISGIAFSVHPVTEDRNQLIIEAGFGLGEAIVSGQVTPDSYVAEKEPRRIIDINVSEQGRALYRKEGGGNEWHELGEKGKTQVLTEAQILELAELIVHIEKHYGFPCDIEWAFESGNFYITQSRPITTLSSPSADSPLAAGGMAEPFEGAWDTDRWLQLGRWLQKPLPSSFWGEKTVPAYFERFFPGHQFSPVFDIHGYYHIARADLDFVIDHFVALHEAGAMRGYIDSLDIAGRELETLYSELLPPDRITARSLKDIFAEHEKLTSFWYAITLVGDALTPAAIKSGVTASEGDFLGLVHPYLRKTWIEDEEMLVRTIATEALRHHDMPTLEQVRELRTGDSEVHELFSLHDARYGWVGISKWEGQPQTEEKLCARVCDAAANIVAGNYVDLHPAPDGKPDALTVAAASAAYWRATCAGLAEQLAHALRTRFELLAQPAGLTYDDVLLLSAQEICRWEESGVLPINLSEMRARATGFALYRGPNGMEIRAHGSLVFDELCRRYAQAPIFDTTKGLKGTPASKGFAEGAVKVVQSHTDFSKFKPGDILVAPETTPAYVPLMRMASAILTERGGVTSHAAIVSRELKKPCIISIPGLISGLKDGDIVEADAEKGVVRILKNTGRQGSEPRWDLWLSRPFDLFSTSVWNEWYVSPHLTELFGASFERGLFVEYPKGTAKQYRESEAPASFGEKISSTATKSASKAGELLSMAERLNAEAEQMIENEKSLSFDEALDFLVRLAHYSIFIPYFGGEALKAAYPDSELSLRCEKLRAVSLYPRFIEKVLRPSAERILAEAGISREYLPFVTTNGLRQGRFEVIQDRRRLSESGSSFLVRYEGSEEQVEYVADASDQMRRLGLVNDSTEIRGSVAYKGVQKGRARILLGNATLAHFADGDILVAISTNPEILPLMRRAGAIVTDEGGATSHAAILARELKKPCIIGTKIATQALRDGDLVEVDAEKGVVRIIERIHSVA